MISPQRLEELTARFANVRVAVLGDFCLDVHWFLAQGSDERSVETGKPVRKALSSRCTPGGAANTAACVAALGCGGVYALGVVGDDMHGRELRRLLEKRGINTRGLPAQREEWDTPAYCKPYLKDEEGERLDFGSRNRLYPETAGALRRLLEETLARTDALIVNQQLKRTIWTTETIAAFNKLRARHEEVFVAADVRDPHTALALKNVVLQVNAAAAARLLGEKEPPDEFLPLEKAWTYAERIHKRTGREVLLTRGERGGILYSKEGAAVQPGLLLYGKVDPVGAGDETIAAFTVAKAAGASWEEAVAVAGFAAAVTVRKLRVTGTASPEEILELGRDPDYVFRPELAADPRKARFLPDSEIEVVAAKVQLGRIRHAVFDWDGTVSTLRQGWEEVMAPMMSRAVLGERHDVADAETYGRVRRRVLDFIDKTTGIQTIVQMELLVELVREFGFVPREDILDRHGYKKIYNAALLEMVRGRLRKMERGELDRDDFVVKGAPEFLRRLKEAGVRLYLASGTDREDVIAEARALGCAEFFEERIYGSVGDVRRYSKKLVLERIMRENELQGPELAVFGDGPVEIRECGKRGGVAVGTASDEVRRYGLSSAKRKRLIEAGADFIVPDFTQGARLWEHLRRERPAKQQ